MIEGQCHGDLPVLNQATGNWLKGAEKGKGGNEVSGYQCGWFNHHLHEE